MEAVVEQNPGKIDARRPGESASPSFDEARARLNEYLRAWRLPDAPREEIARDVIAAIEGCVDRGEELDAVAIAIEEAEKAARARVDELGAKLPPLVPDRALETQPMTMETSLERLPSFRMIAGWFMLIVLIVLTFIFTR